MIPGRDYHLHPYHVGCGAPAMTIPAIFRRAEQIGLTSIGVTDHFYGPEDFAAHEQIRRDIEATPTTVEVFFGVEVTCTDRSTPVSYREEDREQIGWQYAVAGPHGPDIEKYKLNALIDRQVALQLRFIRDPLIDVLVHPWWFSQGVFEELGYPWFGEDFSVVPASLHREIARAAVEHGTAIEVNAGAIFCNPHYSDRFKDQYRDYLAILNEEGVSFSVCSDAHRLNELGRSRAAETVLHFLHVPPERIWTPPRGKTFERLGLTRPMIRGRAAST